MNSYVSSKQRDHRPARASGVGGSHLAARLREASTESAASIGRLQAALSDSPRVMQLKRIQQMVNRRPRGGQLVQRPEEVIQRFPFTKLNQRTNRTFVITKTGSRVEATQVKGDVDDPHWGLATYTVRENSLELEHIVSDPEAGSGIGSLLVYYLAEIANEAGLDTITIYSAAPTALSFYELLGFESANPAGADQVEKALVEDIEEVRSAQDLHVRRRARLKYDTDPENRKFRRKKKSSFFGSEKTRRQWEHLSSSAQQKLIGGQQVKFLQLSPEEQYTFAVALLHGRAVGRTGMVAKTQTVLQKTKPLLSRWVDPEERRVWASRLDTSALTEFPRRPGE